MNIVHRSNCGSSKEALIIRDPVFVLGQMRELFAGGYIAAPNKHVEFNNIETP
jgi:hypothetical protein